MAATDNDDHPRRRAQDRDRWTDDRIDDLNTTVKALAPLAMQIGLLADRVETYTERMDKGITEIVKQTTAVHERVRAVERWVAMAQGAVAVITTAGILSLAAKLLFG